MTVLTAALLEPSADLAASTSVTGRVVYVDTAIVPGQRLRFGLSARLASASDYAGAAGPTKYLLKFEVPGLEKHRKRIYRAMGGKEAVMLVLDGAQVGQVSETARGKEVELAADVLGVTIGSESMRISAKDSQTGWFSSPPASTPASPTAAASRTTPGNADAGPSLRRITDQGTCLYVPAAPLAAKATKRDSPARDEPVRAGKARRVEGRATAGPSRDDGAVPVGAKDKQAGPERTEALTPIPQPAPNARHTSTEAARGRPDFAAAAQTRTEQLVSRVKDMRQGAGLGGRHTRPAELDVPVAGNTVSDSNDMAVDATSDAAATIADDGDERHDAVVVNTPIPNVTQTQLDTDVSPAPLVVATASANPQMDRQERRRRAEAAIRARQEAVRAYEQDEEARMERDLDALRRGIVVNGMTYTPLADVQANRVINVFGVVVHVGSIRPGNGRDHTLTVVLADPSKYDGPTGDHFQVTVFRQPGAFGDWAPGRAVIMHGLGTKHYAGKIKGQAFQEARWAWDGVEAGIVLDPERARLLGQLTRWFAGAAEGSDRAFVAGSPGQAATAPAPVETSKKRQWLTVDRMDLDGGFCNVVVQVLDKREAAAGARYQLFVTDGTSCALPTRNFHQQAFPGVPARAGVQLDMTDEPVGWDRLRPGDVVALENVHLKPHGGEMEMKWSSLLTDTQKAAGWKQKPINFVPAADERARVIARRLEANARAEASSDPADTSAKPEQAALTTPGRAAPTAAAAPAAPAVPATRVAGYLHTKHADPQSHPLSALREVYANATVPNRFRTRARVAAIVPRGVQGGKDALAFQWCSKCNNTFLGNHCLSCNDVARDRVRYRYLLVVELEDAESGFRLPVVVSSGGGGDDADDNAGWLPCLPINKGNDPHTLKRNRQTVDVATEKTRTLLLGAKMDGAHPHPVIEWSLESYHVQAPKPGSKPIIVWRVFGMQAEGRAC
ncbi:hypothetical protein Q5752_002696 [Cryptotrichosporon argae]